MVQFTQWTEAFIFATIYGVIIIGACILITLIGRKMINQLGFYPTKTSIIQMSILYKLILLEGITFMLLIGFLQFFTVEI